jgi:hypothetical protein
VSTDTFARQLALSQIGAGFCGLSLRAQPRPLFLQLHDLHLKILHPVLQCVGPLSQCRNLPGMGPPEPPATPGRRLPQWPRHPGDHQGDY